MSGLFTFTVLPTVNLSLVLADNGLTTVTSVFPLDEIVGIRRVGFLITRSVTCPCGLGIKRTPIPMPRIPESSFSYYMEFLNRKYRFLLNLMH